MSRELWNADVPPKVRIFAWELVMDGLATQDRRNHRGLAPSNVCGICGKGVESGHHAVVSCTKARALWKEMPGRWLLPDDKQLCLTGLDWLWILLSKLNQQQKARVLLLMWRAW
jgi:hypothetical protein